MKDATDWMDSVAFFVWYKHMKSNLHPVYCPRCKKKVMAWNDKSVAPVSAKCRTCGILVIYNPLTSETRLAKIPDRTTASGMRFY